MLMVVKVAKVKLVCGVCGIVFEKYPSQAGKYCSKACVGKAKRHGSVLYCALCDSPFYRRFGEQDLDIRKTQFCSRGCYSEWRVINSKDSTYLKEGARHIHRIVAEAVMGRPLKPGEVVHHKDENKHNNEPSNLVVFPDQSFHARCHFGEMSNEEISRFHIC